LPMFGVVIAFKDYNYNLGVFGSEWVGFENFKYFFLSNNAWKITMNTVIYGIEFIAIGMLASVIVAMLLFEVRSKIAIKTYQTLMLLPYFISWVIVGYISYALLNPELGIFNNIITLFGGQKIQWYAEPKYWPFILNFVNLWKNIGISCIMYYAALMGIDAELFEAAELDGAGKFQQAIKISIPSLVPIMIVLGILAIGNIFRGDFGLFYEIPRDVSLLYPATDIIDTYIYRGLRTGDNLSATAAVGLFQSFVGLMLVIISNKIVKWVSPENTMF